MTMWSKCIDFFYYLTGKPLVDKVKANDAVVAATDETALYDCGQIAVDGEPTQLERRQLHYADGIRPVVYVEGYHIPHLFYIRQAASCEYRPLRSTSVKQEVILLPADFNGKQYAVFIERNGYGVGEVLSVPVIDGEAETVMVHWLGIAFGNEK